MEKIDTEQFLLEELKGLNISSNLIKQNKFKAIEILNRFAKAHRDLIIEELMKKYEVIVLTKEDILECYPDSNIK